MWVNMSASVFFILYGLLSNVQAAVFRGEQRELPGYPNQCYVIMGNIDNRIFFNLSTSAYDEDRCIRYDCLSKTTNGLIYTGVGCGVISAMGCTITEQTKGRYPDCCPKVNCPES